MSQTAPMNHGEELAVPCCAFSQFYLTLTKEIVTLLILLESLGGMMVVCVLLGVTQNIISCLVVFVSFLELFHV